MVDIVLYVRHLDHVGRNFLQADRATENRAVFFVGTMRHQRAAGSAMTGIHGKPLKRQSAMKYRQDPAAAKTTQRKPARGIVLSRTRDSRTGLGSVSAIFRSAARPIRDAAREAGRAAVRAQQADCDKGMRPNWPAPPGCCEKARLRRCAAWQGNDPCRRDAPCIHRFLAATQT